MIRLKQAQGTSDVADATRETYSILGVRVGGGQRSATVLVFLPGHEHLRRSNGLIASGGHRCRHRIRG